MGIPRRSNAEWGAYFKKSEPLGINGKVSHRPQSNDARRATADGDKMTIKDYMEVPSERHAVCRSQFLGTTPIGPYSTEYVWFLRFDENGKNIVSDSGVPR